MKSELQFDFSNKTFHLLVNSEKGEVSSDTIFEYQQDGHLVTADYHGGTIKYGKIIAKLEAHKLHMLYQCLTLEGELKAGKAIAEISRNNNGKMILTLNWEWLGKSEGKGTSQYIEV